MNFGNSTIFQLTKAKMSYLGQRQAVLAANVANVDTPSYKALDIKAPDFHKLLKTGKLDVTHMARTHNGHMLPLNNRGAFPVVSRHVIDEHNPDTNGINIDTEIQKVAFNQAEYDKVVSIYRKNLALIRTAIGNPNG